MTELEKWNTHDGCVGCIHDDLDSFGYPCNHCIGSTTIDSPERFVRKDYYRTDYVVDDAVEHPSHYTHGNIECIDAMEAAFGASELAVYCKIAAFKYIWRMEHKNGFEDLQKASWYINKMIELMKGSE